MKVKFLRELPSVSQLDWLKFLGLFAAYFFTAHFGLSISALHKFATLIWPPTGIALSFLLIFGSRFWPSIFAAAFFVNYMTGAPPIVALGIATGNTLEAWIGCQLCTSSGRGFHLSLKRLEDVVALIVRGALMSTLISAGIGVTSLWLGGILQGAQIPRTFFQWWTGDAIGDLIFAPLILTLVGRQEVERFSWKKGKLLAKVVPWVAACGVSWSVLCGKFALQMAPFFGLKGVYMMMPFPLWVSFRFGQRGSAVISFIIALIGLWFTINGFGPFAESDVNSNLQHLMVLLVVISTTSLFVGAVSTERETERIELEIKTRELEENKMNLGRAKAAAEEANAAKSAFLANMSHEIRTPLGAVLGFSDLLLQGDLSESEKIQSAGAIRRNGKLLSNIVNDILDLSKVEAGKLEVERSPVSLEEILTDLNSLLSLEAKEKGIVLNVVAEGLVPAQVKTDLLRVRQILLNIVGNAIKFTERGSISIRVKLLRLSGLKAQLIFEVKDTGCGISPEQGTKLFEPFSQADISTTRKFGGTGLGLILSRRLAQLLGGNVELAESRLGEGSTFVVGIDPGDLPELKLKTFDSPARIDDVIEMSGAPQLNGLKVLIVDDSLDNQTFISHVLQRSKIETDSAGNGKEAIEKALTKSYDVILMDLQMPEMDGFEATRKLRSRGFKNPIIALTAHAMKDVRRSCIEAGFNEHVTKPIDRAVLLKTIANFAQRSFGDERNQISPRAYPS